MQKKLLLAVMFFLFPLLCRAEAAATWVLNPQENKTPLPAAVSAQRFQTKNANLPTLAPTPIWDTATQQWAFQTPQNQDFTGWLYSYNDLLPQIKDLTFWVDSFKKEYDHVVVLGMGGSSLSAEVLRSLFGKKKGYPQLTVLDSSNPDQIQAFSSSAPLQRTLFIIASKSGTTVEMVYSYYFFYDLLRQQMENPGQNFIAITDEGSSLAQDAHNKNFRALFLNRKDIGGRFSALSYFGMVPALIAGYPVEEMLSRAQQYAAALEQGDTLPLVLAQLIAPEAGKNARRLFIKIPKNLATFSLWIEQMLSESLGKEGKSSLPVVTTRLDAGILKQGDTLVEFTSRLPRNIHATQPYLALKFSDKKDMAKQFLLWEFATVYAAQKMKIDPFNQPDVALSKKMTNEVMRAPSADLTTPFLTTRALKDYSLTEENWTAQLPLLADQADYLNILLFANPTPQAKKEAARFARALERKTKKPVLVTFGPRYLHSLGQTYKGGANNGLFIMISQAKETLPVPGKGPMKDLFLAQAYGDFVAMDRLDRKLIKIHLKPHRSLKQFLRQTAKNI